MPVKFVIASHDVNENAYCKAVCKLVDNSLVDGDFDLYTESNFELIAEYVKTTYASYATKPFIIYPYGAELAYAQYVHNNYPDIFPIMGFVHSPLSTLPLPQPFSWVSSPEGGAAPDKVTPCILVAGGQGGLSDWGTGAGLEFVEPAHVMYLNSGANVLSFPVTSITNQGGGVARINSASLAAFASNVANRWKIHILGTTGLQNSPNGAHNISGVGSGYVEVNFNVGTGSSGGTITCNVEFTSGAIAGVATKIHKIMRSRSCSPGEARMIARVTASNPTRDNTHGYGEINMTNAINYADSVALDDLDLLGAVTTLSKTITGATLILSAPEITNARLIEIYKDSVKILTRSIGWNEDFSYTFQTYEMGNHSYFIKGLRGANFTHNSNAVTTSLTALAGLPLKTKYKKDDYVWTLIDGVIKRLKVLTTRTIVKNPMNDSVGMQLDYYKFVGLGELEISGQKLYSSQNHLLSVVKGDYINHGQILPTLPDDDPTYEQLPFNSISAFINNGFMDLAGLDFNGLDLNDVDFSVYKGVDAADETGLEILFSLGGSYPKVIDGCSFVGCTLKSGQTTRAQVRAAVGSYDEFTTIMPDGLPIGRS